ncbi:hypothetical protein ABZ468_37380 [Streptomyces sp. NPDC005708]|uniref:hypothetical protein n=1 Tax=unclassified Streptomyces TaxID=2593676 RepID=UPI0033DE159F
MPGLAAHTGMIMTCPHGGIATILPAGPPGALVNGLPVATTANRIVVAGCVAQPPCATVQWANVSSVLINGRPMLTQAPPPTPPPVPGGGVCVGSATPGPPLVATMQLLVTGL